MVLFAAVAAAVAVLPDLSAVSAAAVRWRCFCFWLSQSVLLLHSPLLLLLLLLLQALLLLLCVYAFVSVETLTGCRLEVLDCGRVYIHSAGSSPRWGFRLLLTPLLQRLTDAEALRGCNLHLAAELSLLLAACTPKHKHSGKCLRTRPQP